MTKPVILVAWILCCLFAASPVDGAGRPLIFGVLPYVSPGELVVHQHRFEHYLARRLHRPVVMVTAPDFHSFFERTRLGDYDLVLTAPHFARIAELRQGYRPLAITKHHIRGVFIVRRDSTVRNLDELAGLRVIAPVPQAIVHELAIEELARHGLVAGHNVTILNTKTFNNATFAVLRGDCDAAVTGLNLWRHLAPRYRARLRAIGTTSAISGFVLMANPRLDVRTAAKVQAAALNFGNSPAGRHYLFIGFERATAAIMERFDPYMNLVKGWE